MTANKILHEIKNFLEGKTEAIKFANDFEGIFFGNLEELENENYEIYDVLYDDEFIELLPEFKGDGESENALRKKAAEVYFKALKLLPVDQIKQAI